MMVDDDTALVHAELYYNTYRVFGQVSLCCSAAHTSLPWKMIPFRCTFSVELEVQSQIATVCVSIEIGYNYQSSLPLSFKQE